MWMIMNVIMKMWNNEIIIWNNNNNNENNKWK